MTDAGKQATPEWPSDVERMSIDKLDLLGVDSENRLYWNGKRVVTGQRLDLTWWQTTIAALIALFTFVQAWTAYHDWACKVGWPVIAACPHPPRLNSGWLP
jgi:hypothetical protein